ncbi:MAG: CRISPR-associated endoribonuclease Cas6 [Bacilli bacterium]
MFARYQILFKAKNNYKIDYSYNHDITKNIYQYITNTDADFAKQLHNQGFRHQDGHIFKTFNFSLLFNNVQFESEYIMGKKDNIIKLIISGKDNIIQRIIIGILNEKTLKINDNYFDFVSMENARNIRFKETMLFRMLSPTIESTKNDNNKTIYLSPYEEHYYKNIVENAKRKYELMYNTKYNGEIFFEPDNAVNIKEKSIKYKNTFLRGYQFDIWIQAKPEMQKIIYYLGLGQGSSQGAGCLSALKC